jgi:hypothetical protein
MAYDALAHSSFEKAWALYNSDEVSVYRQHGTVIHSVTEQSGFSEYTTYEIRIMQCRSGQDAVVFRLTLTWRRLAYCPPPTLCRCFSWAFLRDLFDEGCDLTSGMSNALESGPASNRMLVPKTGPGRLRVVGTGRSHQLYSMIMLRFWLTDITLYMGKNLLIKW